MYLYDCLSVSEMVLSAIDKTKPPRSGHSEYISWDIHILYTYAYKFGRIDDLMQDYDNACALAILYCVVASQIPFQHIFSNSIDKHFDQPSASGDYVS